MVKGGNMKKRLIVAGIIFLFFISAITPMTFGYNVRTSNTETIDENYNFDSYHVSEIFNYEQQQHPSNEYPVYDNIEPEENLESGELANITLEDDAFHKTYNYYHVETWYFDAVFDNNYSMALNIGVIQKGNHGIVLIGFYLYENTSLISHSRKLHLYKWFSASEEKPILKLYNKTIIEGDMGNNNDSWVYDVSTEIEGQAINLYFVNITKGWKTDTRMGWWLVLPRFNVTGWILLNGKNISVSGEGYHDHNWFYIYTPLIQKGWHFGNIAGDTLGITWVKIMNRCFNSEIIAVLNQKDMNPIKLDSDDVKLSIEKYMFDHGRFIPKIISLQIKNEWLHVDVKMETLNVHHVKLPLVNYWRYHLRIVGTITLDYVSEEIDIVEISELMKFF